VSECIATCILHHGKGWSLLASGSCRCNLGNNYCSHCTGSWKGSTKWGRQKKKYFYTCPKSNLFPGPLDCNLIYRSKLTEKIDSSFRNSCCIVRQPFQLTDRTIIGCLLKAVIKGNNVCRIYNFCEAPHK